MLQIYKQRNKKLSKYNKLYIQKLFYNQYFNLPKYISPNIINDFSLNIANDFSPNITNNLVILNDYKYCNIPKLKCGNNIIKISNNNYNLIVKRPSFAIKNGMIIDLYYDKCITYTIDHVLLDFYTNILKPYINEIEDGIHNVALVLACITCKLDEGKKLYNKLKNDLTFTNYHEYFSIIGEQILISFSQVTQEIFNLNINNEQINNKINLNMIIVAKALKKLNLYDIVEYKCWYSDRTFLHNFINCNNYKLFEYTLDQFKLANKNINDVYYYNKNLVDYIINCILNNEQNIESQLKMYYLLLQNGINPHNDYNFINRYFAVNDIKSIHKSFDDVLMEYLITFVNCIKLSYYPKDLLNIIFFYCK
jgi:hypothetical protein